MEKINIRIENEDTDQLEKNYKYLGNISTEDLVSSTEIKARTAVAKDVFFKKKEIIKWEIKSRTKKNRLLARCSVWSLAVYGAEMWTLRKEDQNGSRPLKCEYGEGWKMSSGKKRLKNEEILRTVKENEER